MSQKWGIVIVVWLALSCHAFSAWGSISGTILGFATAPERGYYSIDTDSGLVTKWASSSDDHNSLGYDSINSKLVHTDHANNNWQLYFRDVELGLSGQVTDISETSTLITSDVRAVFGDDWPGGAANALYDTTGGGAYYDGFYYLIPDIGDNVQVGSPEILLGLQLDETGSIVGQQVIDLPSSIGDFGDITFGNDKMYFLTNLPSSSGRFGYVDLATPSPHVLTDVSSAYKGQLSFDSLGRLWTDNQSTTTLTQLDPDTGEVLSTLELFGDLPGSSWYDFATGPAMNRPGDFDGDEDVDGDDLLEWLRVGGTQEELQLWQEYHGSGPMLPGDFDCDGDVDGDDYLYWQHAGGSAEDLELWREYFGDSNQTTTTVVHSVPEPQTWFLLVFGLIACSQIPRLV